MDRPGTQFCMMLLPAVLAIVAALNGVVAAPASFSSPPTLNSSAVRVASDESGFLNSPASWSSSSFFNLFERKPHPVVVWHGLGDSADAEGMLSFKRSLEEAFPGIYVYLVSLSESGAGPDRNRGFFGNVNDDSRQVCEQVRKIPELQGGFDAVGFSQGGQFIRALVQRCEGIQVRNLVTFGSQHAGIADFPACSGADLLCRAAEAALKSGIYSEWAQTHVVTAQYFRNPRDPDGFEQYLTANHFLTDINNELEQNARYKRRLSSLDTFVMVQFDHDTTVVPKRSSWFESYPVAKRRDGDKDVDDDGDAAGHRPEETIPLRQSEIYTQDRLGLQSLDSRGGLVLELCHGIHMQIDEACQLKVFGKYIGQPSSLSLPSVMRHGWAWLLYQSSGLQSSALPTWIHLILAGIYLQVFIWAVRLPQLIWIRISEGELRKGQRAGAIRLA